MDLYLGEKVPDIECDNLDEAKLCLYVMKEIYHSRMQEYISELTDISQKLQKYDYLLSKKKLDGGLMEPEPDTLIEKR